MISCRQSFKVAAEALSPVTVQSFRREGGPNMRSWWGQEGRSPALGHARHGRSVDPAPLYSANYAPVVTRNDNVRICREGKGPIFAESDGECISCRMVSSFQEV